MPFYQLLWLGGSPTKTDYREEKTGYQLILTSLLEDLVFPPEFMNFKLFGQTILVVNLKFEFFFGHPLSK